MSQLCIDGTTHFFTVYSGTHVYCQKCLELADIAQAPVPPIVIPPIPTDPRPVQVYTPPAGDCTTALQAWMNAQPNNSIWDIRGVASINTAGLRILNRNSVKVTSSTGGGFKAIGTGLYSTPYSSLLYAEGVTDCSFESLRFDGNGKNAQALFVNKSLRPLIRSCEAWNIQNILGGGAPYAAIKADACTDPEISFCNVHDTGGKDNDSGVRGIWCGVGGEYSIRPKIHNNTAMNTGHTGIVTESSGPIVINNTVANVLIQGTGYKYIARGAVADAILDSNTVDSCVGSGIMVEGSPVHPAHIYIRNWAASNVGAAGTSFGMVYISGSDGTKNVEVSGNTLTNCKRIANINYGYNLVFRDNVVTGGVNTIDLENEVHGVIVTRSGFVNVGSNVTNVVVDGVVIVP